jgi:hypothetical protein
VSVWDKISGAWDWTEKAGASIGGALAGANHAVTDAPVIGGIVGGLEKGVGVVAENAVIKPLVAAGELDSSIYNNVINRPLSTALQVGYDRPVWEMFDKSLWSDAWQKSNKISWGQALAIDWNGDFSGHSHERPGIDDFSMTAGAQAARANYFANDWHGKLSSGAIDLFGNVALDPLAAAGKAAKAGSIARYAVKGADELNAVMDAASGAAKAEDLTRHQASLANNIVDIVTKHTEDKSAVDIANLPWFRRSSNGGTFAYLMDYANTKFADDETARFAAKQQVLGAMLGHKGSIDALRTQQADLAAEVDALLKPPGPSVAYGTFTFDDAGKAVWEGANATEVPPHILDKADDIEQQAGRLAQVVGPQQGRGAAALSDLRGGGILGQAGTKLRQSYITTGYAAKPVRVIAATISNRLPGYITTVDSHIGFQDLKTYLSKAVYLKRDTREELLNLYQAAGTKAARAEALQEAEREVHLSIARKYNVDPLTAKAINDMGRKTSDVIRGVIKQRAYSADPKAATVLVHDPLAGEYVAVPRPLASSQIEDAMVMADPIQLNKVYRTYYQERYLDHIPKIGTPAADTLYGPIRDGAEMLAHAFTSVWRFATLLNPGYPLRVLSDSVLRANIYMGPVQYAAQMPAIAKAIYKAGRSDRTAVTALFKGDTEKVLRQYLMDMGLPEADVNHVFQNVAAVNGSMADVMSETADRLQGHVVGSGQWSVVRPTDKDWSGAYTRAINQIRVSPIAMAAVRGLEGRSLRNFILTDPAARREWLELRGANENDVDQLVSRVEAHVNSLLPTNDSRAWVSGNDVMDAAGDVVDYKPRRLPSKRIRVDNPDKPGKKKLVPNPKYDEIVKLNAQNAQQRIAVLQAADGYKGRSVGPEQLQKWFGDGSGPLVHGESFNPVAADTATSRTMARLNNIRSGYYRWAGEGPDNMWARFPQYRYVYFQELKRIKKTLGADASLEDLNLARRTADHTARREVSRTMYNASDTSRMANTMRFTMPFYSAWEDTMRKYGRLFYEKPWAPMRVGSVWNAPNHNGMLHDEYGNTIVDGEYYDKKTHRKLDPKKDLIGNRRLVTLPLNWMPQRWRDGLDKTLGLTGEDLDIDSLNSVFQGDPWYLPGTGPLVQIPMNKLIRESFPEAENNAIIRWVLPFGTSDSDAQAALPAKWNRLYNAVTDSKDYEETLKNIIAWDTENFMQGKGGQPNIEQEAKKARLFTLLRAGLNFNLPFRLEADQDGQFYIDQAKVYRQRYTQDPAVLSQYIGQYGRDAGMMKYQADHPSWQEKFYQDYPQYFMMGSSLSANETGIVGTIKASDTAAKYGNWVSQNREWGWLVVGPDNAYGNTPDTQFSQAANNRERNSGMRDSQNAQAAVDRQAINQGWIQYQAAATKVNLLLEQKGITRDDKEAQPLVKLLSSYAKVLGKNNIAWANDYGQMNTQKSLLALYKASNAMEVYPELKRRPDMRAIAQYAQARNQMMGLLASRPHHTLDARSNADLKKLWTSYTGALLKNNIGFEQVYNRVLVHDKLDIVFDPKSAGGIGEVLSTDENGQQP